jgi:hypothetical protein
MVLIMTGIVAACTIKVNTKQCGNDSVSPPVLAVGTVPAGEGLVAEGSSKSKIPSSNKAQGSNDKPRPSNAFGLGPLDLILWFEL